MRPLLRLLLSLALAWPFCGTAADFRLTADGHGVLISGRIVKGDFARLAVFAKDSHRYGALLTEVDLDSPGGDVAEAMKISNFLSRAFAMTVVQEDAVCASSCFLLWSAGVVRMTVGTLGVHRLSLSTPNQDLRDAERVLLPASATVERFLVSMGIPNRVLEKMKETSPRDIFILSDDWLGRQDVWEVMQYRPAYLDIAEQQCGPEPYNVSVRTHRKVDADAASKWRTCEMWIRYKNQEKHMDDIVDLLESAVKRR